MIPTIIGNGLIVLCILKYRKLRCSMHVLICNLAISDLIVGVVLIPADTISDFLQLKENKYVCLSVFATFVISLGSSSINLLFISIERFIAIVFPFRAKFLLTKTRMMLMITCGWTITIVNGTVPFYSNTYTNSTPECLIEHVWTKQYRTNTDWQLLISLILNFMFYAIVVCIAVRKTKHHRNASTGNNFNTPARARKDLHHLITMAIVLGMFMLCWFPYACLSVIVTFWDTPYYHFVKRCALIPGLINSGINWIIYGYRKREFRRAFGALIKCRKTFVVGSVYTPRVSSIS